MKTPILETNHLILRPVRIDDSPAVQKFFNDWDIIKYITVAPWPYPDDGAMTFLQGLMPKIENGEAYVWAITLKNQNDVAIGLINFRPNHAKKHDQRGFWLAKEHQKQGYMSEAVTVVNNFIFDTLNVDAFYTKTVRGNIGSTRIKEITGGVITHQENEVTARGDSVTMDIWKITKDDWLKTKPNHCDE